MHKTLQIVRYTTNLKCLALFLNHRPVWIPNLWTSSSKSHHWGNPHQPRGPPQGAQGPHIGIAWEASSKSGCFCRKKWERTSHVDQQIKKLQMNLNHVCRHWRFYIKDVFMSVWRESFIRIEFLTLRGLKCVCVCVLKFWSCFSCLYCQCIASRVFQMKHWRKTPSSSTNVYNLLLVFFSERTGRSWVSSISQRSFTPSHDNWNSSLAAATAVSSIY